MFQRTDDLRIAQVRPLLPPAILIEEIPVSERASNVVTSTRSAIANVLSERKLLEQELESIRRSHEAIESLKKLATDQERLERERNARERGGHRHTGASRCRQHAAGSDAGHGQTARQAR